MLILDDVGAVVLGADTIEVRFGNEGSFEKEKDVSNAADEKVEYDAENEIGQYIVENGIGNFNYPVEDFDEEMYDEMYSEIHEESYDETREDYKILDRAGIVDEMHKKSQKNVVYSLYPKVDMRYSGININKGNSEVVLDMEGNIRGISLTVSKLDFTGSEIQDYFSYDSFKEGKNVGESSVLTSSGLGIYEIYRLEKGEIGLEILPVMELI